MSSKNKHTKLTLSEVETQMEVLTKEEIGLLKGGGDGSYHNPYTIDDFNLLIDHGIFVGGYVEGMGYVNALEPVTVVGPSKKNPGWGSEFSYYKPWENQNPGESNNEPIYGPEQYVGGGGGSNSSHYTNNDNNNNDSFNFSQTVSDLWNSTVARVIVPDVLSFNLSTSATAFIGVNFEFSVNFITRGNDASLIPTITFSPGAQVGAGVSADASVGISRGYFMVTDVRTLQEGQSVERIGGWSIEGVLTLGSGVGGTINASIGLDENGKPAFFKLGTSGGVSIGGSSSIGASHTLIVRP